MARRPTSRSQVDDSANAAPARPKLRRSRAAAPAGETASATPPTSASMKSEPSQEDIRIRAYHRYLERGGGHGMEFEDWLLAERELKSRQ